MPKESTDGLPTNPDLPQVAREWYSPEMAALLRRLVSERKVDIVHIEFLQMAFYVRCLRGIPAVFTEHDVSHLSLFHSYFREWRGWQRWFRLGEWLRTRRYHADVCRRFDRVVSLTPNDARRLAGVIPPERVALIPTCVDLEKFSYAPEGEGGRPVDMAYVGHYPHYPNEDAALWFCRKVLPRIRAARPRASLSLIGSSPTEPVRALAGEGVEVTGTVPDIRPFLDRAKVFVAPVRLGFGIKGKVLESFARGIPVVATSVVRRGIPQAVAGEHVLVADDPAGFARQTLRLLQDSGLRRRLAKNGRRLVRRHYDWKFSCDKLYRVYTELSGGGPVAPEERCPAGMSERR